eukprot:m.8980 g.8980  ORF g.8980 m.8980 type:complete len:58 (-) comp6792_c0_seq1:45-218(-)
MSMMTDYPLQLTVIVVIITLTVFYFKEIRESPLRSCHDMRMHTYTYVSVIQLCTQYL